MLYLGIDLHRKQMTVSLRNDDGDVLLRRQVSTRWSKLDEFREQLHQAAAGGERFVAVVEVCGFHDWLVRWLQQWDRCQQVLVVQPLGRTANKTDRRDAHALSELLWVNRTRLLRGDRVQGVRTVHLPTAAEQADRQLTQLRERLVRRRTQTLNQIHKILRRHNLEWERPTKSFQTRKVTLWLKTLQFEPTDTEAVPDDALTCGSVRLLAHTGLTDPRHFSRVVSLIERRTGRRTEGHVILTAQGSQLARWGDVTWGSLSRSAYPGNRRLSDRASNA